MGRYVDAPPFHQASRCAYIRKVERLERAIVTERRDTLKGAGRCSNEVAYETDKHEEEKDTTYQSYDNSGMLSKSFSANIFCLEPQVSFSLPWYSIILENIGSQLMGQIVINKQVQKHG